MMRFNKWFMLVLLGLAALDAFSVSAQKEDKEEEEDTLEPTFSPTTAKGDGPNEGDVDSPAMAPNMGTEEGGFECPGAPIDADCEECLREGCSMTIGECMIGCVVADAPCWSMEFSNGTEADVCAMMQTFQEDSEICGTCLHLPTGTFWGCYLLDTAGTVASQLFFVSVYADVLDPARNCPFSNAH
jgi:hypothetical protein